MKRSFELNYGEIISPQRVNPIKRTNLTAKSLEAAMQYGSAKYPEFAEQGIDWMAIPGVGIVMKTKSRALILRDLDAEDINSFAVFG